MRNKKVLSLVFVALFAAIISAGALIAVPIGPVPIVLQNFFTLLSGLVLGPLLGAVSVGLFLAAGIIGAPVFANNGSPMGIARIIGPTGGFYFGYLLGALVAGLIRLKWVLNLSWPQTFMAGLVPFLPGDAVKGVIAGLIAPRLRKTAAQLLSA